MLKGSKLRWVCCVLLNWGGLVLLTQHHDIADILGTLAFLIALYL